MVSKSAGLKDVAKAGIQSAIDYVKNNPHDLAGMVGGAALASLGTYLASRPGKGGRSIDQGKAAPRLKAKKDESFVSGMGRIVSNTRDDIADLAAKHPFSAALSSVPAGAAFGKMVAGKIKGASMNSDLEKFAEAYGREMAQKQQKTYDTLTESLMKMASLGELAGQAGKAIMNSKAGTRAGVGAAIGGAKYLMSNDPNKGVGTLAADVGGGALAGLGAKRGVSALANAAKTNSNEHIKNFGQEMVKGMRSKSGA